MRAVLRLAREIASLFFDDGSLAIAVLTVLATTAILLRNDWADGLAAAAFLVFGVVVALIENVIRTARVVYPRVE